MEIIRIGNYPFDGPEADTCSAKSFAPGPKCKYPGYGPETIGFLCDYLRKPYEIVNFPENTPIGGLEADGNEFHTFNRAQFSFCRVEQHDLKKQIKQGYSCFFRTFLLPS